MEDTRVATQRPASEMARQNLPQKTTNRNSQQHAKKRNGRNPTRKNRRHASKTLLHEMLHTQHVHEVLKMKLAIKPELQKQDIIRRVDNA